MARAIYRLPDCTSLCNSAKADASAISYRGSSGTGGGWHFRGRRLGLVGDQFAQERNQHDERNTDREAAGAKLREELRAINNGLDTQKSLCRLMLAPVTYSPDDSTHDETAAPFCLRSSRSFLHLYRTNGCTTIAGRTGG